MSESKIPNLRLFRITAGISQDQLAEAIGVNARTILRWEQGKQDPNLTDLRRLAAHFGVSVARLIGEEAQA